MSSSNRVVTGVGLLLYICQFRYICDAYSHRSSKYVNGGYHLGAYRSSINLRAQTISSSSNAEIDENSFRKNVELYDKYGSLSSVSSDILSSSISNERSIYGADDASTHDFSDMLNVPVSSPIYSPIYGAKPEVLSPAGGWPQLRAAVANGANACYFGLQEGFNARWLF